MLEAKTKQVGWQPRYLRCCASYLDNPSVKALVSVSESEALPMPTITPGHRKKLTRASDAPFRGAGAPQWTLEASSKSPICNKHLSGPQRNDSVPMMTRGWLFLNSTLKVRVCRRFRLMGLMQARLQKQTPCSGMSRTRPAEILPQHVSIRYSH